MPDLKGDIVLQPYNPPVSLLYVPASKPRAMEKALTLDVDAIILDLEDAVAPDDKIAARDTAVAAIRDGYAAGKSLFVRINGVGTAWHADDLAAFSAVRPNALQIPKVESAQDVAAIAQATGLPLLPMIETATGVFAARDIAAAPSVLGLVAGLNDLAMDLGVPDPADRNAMQIAIQMMLLAARAAGVLAYDGVWTGLDDVPGLVAECAQGRRFGFDGKTLIHPNQVLACNAAWLPSAVDLADAKALVAAAQGGAQRHNGKMVEDMHIRAAERLIARAALRGVRENASNAS